MWKIIQAVSKLKCRQVIEETILNVCSVKLSVDSSPKHYVSIITWEILSENLPAEFNQHMCLGKWIDTSNHLQVLTSPRSLSFHLLATLLFFYSINKNYNYIIIYVIEKYIGFFWCTVRSMRARKIPIFFTDITPVT